ncbi:hypothetical protein [Oceanospirillum linum]|uniref:Uncharacterized protein n=1 Tax=Oceanospirillum linum TaxID=966 RepID=A0A1T1HE62_OCELI|nr:hypothetical protein [Oceanospirillum linum]OOV88139.1 hypothetical protein BTA35_0200890 [Oceanospirillum linum]SEF44492.1 hypothetical protein SAMN04489856_101182 [Oleiphilus messinensis]SMP01594.1 hypothetical protein SAMN06264348_101183 [Oceanospirillum linum]
MDPLAQHIHERARQLTRDLLEPHTEVFKGAAELTASGSQALGIVNSELTRLALNCPQTEEKKAIIEGFSRALAQLEWNAEDAADLVRNLEKELKLHPVQSSP